MNPFFKMAIYGGCMVLVMFGSTSLLNAQVDVGADRNDSGVNFSEWILKKPTGAEAEFKMPVQPRYIERSFSPVQNEPPIKVRLHLGTTEDNSATFVFGYHDLHQQPSAGKQTEDTLDGAVRGSVANVAGKLLDHGKIRYGENPGRQFTYLYAQQEKVYQVVARVLLVGNRQYQLSSIMPRESFDSDLSNQFLNSFRIAKPDSDLPPRPPARDRQKSG